VAFSTNRLALPIRTGALTSGFAGLPFTMSPSGTNVTSIVVGAKRRLRRAADRIREVGRLVRVVLLVADAGPEQRELAHEVGALRVGRRARRQPDEHGPDRFRAVGASTSSSSRRREFILLSSSGATFSRMTCASIRKETGSALSSMGGIGSRMTSSLTNFHQG
jgi:hypothetical protein